MRKLLLPIAVCILAGCATTKATQLGQNTHRIEMRGNAFTDETKAEDQAFLKAAETTIDAGHRYFVVHNVEDRSSTAQVFVPGSSTTSLNATATSTGPFTNLNGTATTTTRPSTMNTVNKPGLDAVITTYIDPVPGSVDAFEVVTFFGQRLNGKRWTPEAVEALK